MIPAVSVECNDLTEKTLPHNTPYSDAHTASRQRRGGSADLVAPATCFLVV